MINIFKTELSNNNIVSHVTSKNNTLTIYGVNMNISREILCDIPLANNANPNFKYCEKIELNTNNSDYAIALGYNPAMANINTIDSSNKYLCNFFNNNYAGYYLINFYPDVASNSKGFKGQNIISILKDVLRIYRQNKQASGIYLFTGENLLPVEMLFAILDELRNYSLYYIVDSKNKFNHISMIGYNCKEIKLW